MFEEPGLLLEVAAHVCERHVAVTVAVAVAVAEVSGCIIVTEGASGQVGGLGGLAGAADGVAVLLQDGALLGEGGGLSGDPGLERGGVSAHAGGLGVVLLDGRGEGCEAGDGVLGLDERVAGGLDGGESVDGGCVQRGGAEACELGVEAGAGVACVGEGMLGGLPLDRGGVDLLGRHVVDAHRGGVRVLGAAADGARLTGDELCRELARDAVVCAFPEPNHDPRPIQRLVEGTPVKLGAALDPEGSTLTFSADLYQKMIRGMADTMLNCLSQG